MRKIFKQIRKRGIEKQLRATLVSLAISVSYISFCMSASALYTLVKTSLERSISALAIDVQKLPQTLEISNYPVLHDG